MKLRRQWRAAEGSGRAITALGLVLVALTAVSGLFFWSYLNHIKREVARRDHRVLASALRQLQFRMDGTISALHQALLGCEARPDFGRCIQERLVEIPGAELAQPSGRYARGYESQRTGKAAGGRATLEQEPGMVIFVEGQPERFQLVIALHGARNSRRKPVWVRSDLTDTLATISQQRAFQAVFLADDGYHLLYRSNATAVPIGDLRELIRAETGPAGGDGTEPNRGPAVPLHNGAGDAPVISAVGDDYNVFVKRGKAVHVLHDAASGERIEDLVFIGVARDESFVDESRVLPPALTSAIAVILVVSLLLLPVARLFWIAPQERLTRRDVALIAGGGFMAVALLFFLVTDAFLHRQLRAQHARVADALAADIERTVTDGVCDLAVRLRHALRSRPLPAQGSARPVAPRNDVTLTSFSDRPAYTFAISLIGVNGRMGRYWEYKPEVAESLHENKSLAGNDYSDRRYFADVQAENLLRTCPKSDGIDDLAFSVEVVQSRLSGRPTIALAIPAGPPLAQALPNGAKYNVLTIGTPQMHIAPIVPPGYSYAIVDDGGDVQFHSDVQRAKVENLLAEIDDSEPLAHALRFHASGSVGAFGYLGNPVWIHLRPMSALPGWTIVVAQERQLERTLHGLAVLDWTTQMAVYLALLGAVTAFVLMARPPSHRWMTPQPARAGAYLHTAVLIGVIAATGAVTRMTYPQSIVAVGGFLVPLCVLALLLARFAWMPRENRLTKVSLYVLVIALWLVLWVGAWVDEDIWGGRGEWIMLGVAALAVWPGSRICRAWAERSPTRLTMAYAAMITLAFIVLAGVPSACFVREAYRGVVVNSARYGQVEVVRQILDHTAEALQGGATTRTVGRVTPWNWPNFLPTPQIADPARSWMLEVCRCGEDHSACPAVECRAPARRQWYDASLEFATDTSTAALQWITGLDSGDALGIRFAVNSFDSDHGNGWRGNRCGDDVMGLCVTDPRWPRIIRGFTGAPFAVATVPLSIDRLSRNGLTALFLCTGLLALAAFLTIKAVARRLYVLFDKPWSGSGAPGVNATVGGSPHLFLYVRASASTDAAAEATVLDVRECERADGPAWSTARILPDSGTVILDYFDHRLDVAPLNCRRLRLLESLLERDLTVGIISAVNLTDCTPIFRSDEGPFGRTRSWADIPERRRWARALSLFSACSVPLDGSTVATLVPPGLAAAVAAHTAARQPTDLERIAIWNSLTNAEKLVLVQIASEGYANYKNGRVLRSLLDRGLIRRDPLLALANDAWRRFTLHLAQSEPVRRWERELAPRTVDALLIPIGVLVIAIMALLFVTQQDQAVKIVSALGGLATFVSVAAKFIGTSLDRSIVRRAVKETMVA